MDNPTLSWNLVSDVHELLEYPFMVNALEAASDEQHGRRGGDRVRAGTA